MQIRICATATPVQLLRAVEAAEDVVDDPARLGDWHRGRLLGVVRDNTTEGRLRGLALSA